MVAVKKKTNYFLQFEGVPKKLSSDSPRVHLSQGVQFLEVVLVVPHLADGGLVTGNWRERMERRTGQIHVHNARGQSILHVHVHNVRLHIRLYYLSLPPSVSLSLT